MRRIRRHLTYSNVMVTLLAFIVLTGGTAVALSGTNTVFTDDIANDTQPAGGGNPAGGLVAADLRPNSVGSSEAANNSLTGQDVNESTLQGVNAATVDGADVCHGVVELSTSSADPSVQQEVCAAGPLSIRARCRESSNTTQAFLELFNSANHSFYARTWGGGGGGPGDADWNIGEPNASALTETAVATGANGVINRGSFSAGAADGSQLAGEVASAARHLTRSGGTCQFALGVIG